MNIRLKLLSNILYKKLCGRIYPSMTIISFTAISLILSGCSFFDTPENMHGETTLKGLRTSNLPENIPVTIPDLNLNKIQENYQRALASNQDPRMRQLIRLRLADIEMTRSEDKQMASNVNSGHFQGAIDQYRLLLAEQDPSAKLERTDYLQYQLAKAYALDGQIEASSESLNQLSESNPDSPFIIESLFRRAELYFSHKDFRSAARDYQAVMSKGESPFYQNANYMLGWSQFKLTNYDGAAIAFTQVIDQLTHIKPFSELEKSQKNLANDSLRVLALTFSYLDGAESIDQFFEDNGARNYQHRYYMALGGLYLDKERYRDSADTFNRFVNSHPDSNHSPKFSLRAIESYELGNFPSEILPAKRAYVKNYGINSSYWHARDESQREYYQKVLHLYIPELAKVEHANAQKLQKTAENKSSHNREFNHLKQQSQTSYLIAADYYLEFSQTFPLDTDTAEMVFLMAECFNSADKPEQAFDAYEQVAYDYQDKNRGSEAGYAAILSAKTLANRPTPDNQNGLINNWQELLIRSSLRFADRYPENMHALPVLLSAAENLYQQKNFAEAIAAANRVNLWLPEATDKQQLNALLIIGHSQFELTDYLLAENAYRQVLAVIKTNNIKRTSIDKKYILKLDTQQRLAASIYQQAQQAYKAGETENAIDHLLRLKQTGSSEIASSGHYDAINYLIELKQYSKAHTELIDFRRRYPQHKLSGSLTAKAVIILLALERPAAAADELSQLAKTDPDPEVRRESLFLAADNYRKAGDEDAAIEHYRNYAHTYKKSHGQKVEAQYQLSELYSQKNDTRKRNFWLIKLSEYQYKQPRGLYLAAFASTELADQEYDKFSAIKLNLPLKKSLKNKKRALKKTISAYNDTLDLGVAEFTTRAHYRLGEIYQQLSQDLINAEKPKNLNELELEQYNILLEEQAYPFEEKAIEIHSSNIARSRDGFYDDGVKNSFASLAKLLPARYNKPEKQLEFSDAIF